MRGLVRATVAGAALGAALMVSTALGALLLDDFDDGAFNPGRWATDTFGSGVTVQETDGHLQFDFAANAAQTGGGDQFNAFYYGECDIRGDFDVQVDFDLLTWPNASGVRLAMIMGPFSIQRVSFGDAAADFPGFPREEYATGFPSNLTLTPTDDMSGKLRLTRVGTTVMGYYNDGGTWVMIDSESNATTEDLSIELGSWSHDYTFLDEPVSAAFDNVLVDGEVSCALRNGDLDCDGDVDGRDALIAMIHDAGAEQISRGFGCPDLNGPPFGALGVTGPSIFGDVNCDETVGAGDGLTLLQHLASVPLDPAPTGGCVAIGARFPD